MCDYGNYFWKTLIKRLMQNYDIYIQTLLFICFLFDLFTCCIYDYESIQNVQEKKRKKVELNMKEAKEKLSSKRKTFSKNFLWRHGWRNNELWRNTRLICDVIITLMKPLQRWPFLNRKLAFLSFLRLPC